MKGDGTGDIKAHRKEFPPLRSSVAQWVPFGAP